MLKAADRKNPVCVKKFCCKLQDVVEGLDLDRDSGHSLGAVVNGDVACEHGCDQCAVVVGGEAVSNPNTTITLPRIKFPPDFPF